MTWIVMFAIPVQGFAAASMLFCGPGTAHHAQAAVAEHKHAPGTPAHDHHAAAKTAIDAGLVKLGDGTAAPDLMHKCGVCAACCHAVAIAQTPLVMLPVPPDGAVPAEPAVSASSRPSLVPDKPPRT